MGSRDGGKMFRLSGLSGRVIDWVVLVFAAVVGLGSIAAAAVLGYGMWKLFGR